MTLSHTLPHVPVNVDHRSCFHHQHAQRNVQPDLREPTRPDRVQQDGPLTEEAARLRLAEALVEKVRETDAGDTDKVQWYLDQIKELGRKEGPRERSE